MYSRTTGQCRTPISVLCAEGGPSLGSAYVPVLGTCRSSNVFGAATGCNITCNMGYAPSGSAVATYTCGADGLWSGGPAPTCNGTPTPRPLTLSGHVRQRQPRVAGHLFGGSDGQLHRHGHALRRHVHRNVPGACLRGVDVCLCGGDVCLRTCTWTCVDVCLRGVNVYLRGVDVYLSGVDVCLRGMGVVVFYSIAHFCVAFISFCAICCRCSPDLNVSPDMMLGRFTAAC